MFKRYKDGQKKTARQIYKVMLESESLGNMLAWMRRNYPEVKKDDK